jgi:hypothetical protein
MSLQEWPLSETWSGYLANQGSVLAEKIHVGNPEACTCAILHACRAWIALADYFLPDSNLPFHRFTLSVSLLNFALS